METDSLIERTIIQQLSHPDKRYTYNHSPEKASTEELIADCAYLDDLTSEGPATPFSEQHQQFEKVEEDVEAAAERLQEQGLLTKVGEKPLKDGLFGEQIGTTAVWKPTEEGLAEAQRINEQYSHTLASLVEDHGDPERVPVDELLPVLKTYGVVPDRPVGKLDTSPDTE